jgi:antitoxin VapB
MSVALYIANPVVVAKVERLARALGLTKTAVVERAIDRLASELARAATPQRMSALLRQLDQIPDRPDAFDPLEWRRSGNCARQLTMSQKLSWRKL